MWMNDLVGDFLLSVYQPYLLVLGRYMMGWGLRGLDLTTYILYF